MIGGTRLVPLRRLVPRTSARLTLVPIPTGGTVVTVAVDTGMKYLSTALYAGA